MMNRFPKLIMMSFVSFTFALMSCSEKKVDKVSISMTPATPVVIEADYSTPDTDPGEDDNSETYEGPWFQFQVKVSNPTDNPITIVLVGSPGTELEFAL